MAMITYPLNNIEYTAEDAELFHCTRTSGIWVKDSFPISVTGADNNITIGTGIAWINNEEFSGKVTALKTPEIHDLGIADAVYPRIDVVALQFSANANATSIVVKKGTPASSPVRPAIVRTGSIYELYLYQILRPAGATTVTAANVTDLRLDESVCGLMTDSVSKGVTAAAISYDNNTSGLDASTVQAAVDELAEEKADNINFVKSGSGAKAGLVPAPSTTAGTTKYLREDGTWTVPPNNTAGSTNSSSKLFLIGATAQAANPQTYSHDTAYVGTDGCLYSGGKKVVTGDYLPLSGGSMTGAIKMKNGVAYQVVGTGGTARTGMMLNSNNDLIIGGMNQDNAHTGSTFLTSLYGDIMLDADKGISFDAGTGISFNTGGGAGIGFLEGGTSELTGVFRPVAADAGTINLGNTSYPWYRCNGKLAYNTTSDAREKSGITPIAELPSMYSKRSSVNPLEQLFDELIPSVYYVNGDVENNLHIGFIAQDIAEALERVGMSEKDMGLITHEFWTDEETEEEKDRYSLAYEELTPLNTYMIQKLQKRIDDLEERISHLDVSE